MTDLMIIWLLTGGLTGVIISGAGYWMKIFPPAKINLTYGYRTKQSMMNQRKWDAAQKYSANKMIISGIIMLIISILRPLIHYIPVFSDIAEVLIACALPVIACIIVFLMTEQFLKNKLK